MGEIEDWTAIRRVGRLTGRGCLTWHSPTDRCRRRPDVRVERVGSLRRRTRSTVVVCHPLEDELRGQLEDSGCDVRGRELEREIARVRQTLRDGQSTWRFARGWVGIVLDDDILRAADTVDVVVFQDVECLPTDLQPEALG